MTSLRPSEQPAAFLGHAYSCTRCGQPAAVAVPHGMLWRSPTNGDVRPIPGYGDPDLCLPCRLAAVEDDAQPSLIHYYNDLRREGAREGAPDGPTLWHFYTAFPDGDPSWDGWRVRVLAVRVLNGFAEGHDSMHLRDVEGLADDFLIYQTKLWNETIPGAEVVFHSGPHRPEPTPELFGLRDLRPTERARVLKGVELYYRLRGAGGIDAYCYENILVTIRALRADGQKTTQSAVADMIYGRDGDSRDSLKKCLRRARERFGRSMRWGDVLQDAG